MRNQDPTRLSALESVVLKMLINKGGEMFGLEMVDNSGNRLKKGTIYVTLSRMEGKDFIQSRKEPKRPGARGLPRRLYQITDLGMEVLQNWELSWLPKGIQWEG